MHIIVYAGCEVFMRRVRACLVEAEQMPAELKHLRRCLPQSVPLSPVVQVRFFSQETYAQGSWYRQPPEQSAHHPAAKDAYLLKLRIASYKQRASQSSVLSPTKRLGMMNVWPTKTAP